MLFLLIRKYARQKKLTASSKDKNIQMGKNYMR